MLTRCRAPLLDGRPDAAVALLVEVPVSMTHGIWDEVLPLLSSCATALLVLGAAEAVTVLARSLLFRKLAFESMLCILSMETKPVAC